MTLAVISQEDVVKRIEERLGSLSSVEAISELIRAEVHARGSALRATTIERVVNLVTSAVGLSSDRVADVCDLLEREGDLVLAPGGVLHATPVRTIPTGERARVVASLPTRALRAMLDQSVDARGASRSTSNSARLADVVKAIGGVLMTPEAWAGTDHAPIADDRWLDSLDRRLEWDAASAGSLERDGTLDWSTLVLTEDGPRWKRGGGLEARLWRAKSRFGYRLWAWCAASTSPSMHSFVALTRDEAWRSVFALARVMGVPIQARAQHTTGFVRLSLDQPLPHAEYRYLSVQAEDVDRDDKGTTWTVSVESASDVRALLARRLGIEWNDAGQAALQVPPPPPLPPPPTTPVHSKSLDELVPIDPAMGPLLQRLGIRTYRDLLTLDLTRLEKKTGVGRLKLKRLLGLVDEAKQRIAERSTGTGENSPSNNTPYEDWSPFEALGRILAREAGVLEHARIKTVRELRQFLRNTRPRDVGQKTYTTLVDRVRRLDEEGYESLVFGGAAPNSIQELGERYLAQLDAREREMFGLRFVKGLTLEQVGQHFKLTRERVRQVIETELAADRRAWTPRTRELLHPAVAHIEAQGGIALTSKVLQLLGAPQTWTLDLAIELADVSVSMEVVPRVTTMLAAKSFYALRREVRADVEARLAVDMSSSVLASSLAEFGVSVAVDEFADLADAMLGVTVDGEQAYLNRQSTRGIYLSVLHDAGGPISAEEVARRVNAIDPSLEARPNLAVSNLRRTGQVFSLGHGEWIHQDHLPVSIETLESLAAECLPIVEQAGGAAVSMRTLLKALVSSGRASRLVTPNLLRDALIRTGKVRGWRVGSDVAWLGGDVQRRTIAEWINEVASELEQPFTIEELVAEVATRSGYVPGSIGVQVMANTDALIRLADGEWVSTEAIFDGQEQFSDAVEYVREIVAGQMLVSARSPTFNPSRLQKLVAQFGKAVFWGLATRANGIVTRARGLLMWPASRGSTLWSVIRNEFLAKHPVCRSAELSEYLAAVSGLVDDPIAWALMQEGVHEGHIRPIGMAWHVDNHVPFEKQVELLEQQHEVVRMALGSQDFVRESPARDLLNELRVRHGSFRVPAG